MKFKVRWTEEVDFEVEIETKNEEEAKRKAREYDYDTDAREDISEIDIKLAIKKISGQKIGNFSV